MKFGCKDYIPLTHPTYAMAGCYGCADAHISIDVVWCSKEHWCLPMLLPVMSEGSKFFECSDCIRDDEEVHIVTLCEDCSFLDENDCCAMGKELREVVVRFE